jgi:signal transduction histidine kinase
MIKTGKDTVFERSSFSHHQNNFSFYFAATSFFDEKQTLYSYRLHGGSNNQWSEPSNNSSVSFIDLPAGEYTLEIKAIFPAGRYPEQFITYKFSISPAWWQTWWFRVLSSLVAVTILTIIFRSYYRRKLERQKSFLEKQQAIERERTRIATDMHDDLGAGLSRIKFLSQSLLNKKKDEIMKPELEKITAFSDEMSEKMGEIIWALNEKNDTLADLIAYTRSYAAEYLASHDIQCEANTPMNLPGTFITGEMRRNIFLSVKECLHNIVKHAGATKVCFSIELNHTMQIIIHDNGKGIDWNFQRSFSNGVQNIEKRMKEINGRVSFKNEKGTKVSLTIPISL